MVDRKKYVHVLVSASYLSHIALPSSVFTALIGKTMDDAPTIEPERIITYQMGYSISPAQCGLKDNWDCMTDEEREGFSESYPELATAIALMCGNGVDNADARSKGSAETGLVQGQDGTDS